MEKTSRIERLAEEILALLSRKVGRDELIVQIVLKIKATLDFEAVGLRLNDGDEYPYKRIRDEEGHWRDLETYIKSRSGAEFSHGVCPVCYEQAMGKME